MGGFGCSTRLEGLSGSPNPRWSGSLELTEKYIFSVNIYDIILVILSGLLLSADLCCCSAIKFKPVMHHTAVINSICSL